MTPFRAAPLLLAALSLPPSPAAATGSLGVGILMTPGDASPVSKAIADRFVRPMLKVADGKPTPPFAWGRQDVTGSGYGELFLAFTDLSGCSDAGCPIIVMKRKADGAWKPILQVVATYVGSVGHGPASDVVVEGRPGETATYAWDPGRDQMRPVGKGPGSGVAGVGASGEAVPSAK